MGSMFSRLSEPFEARVSQLVGGHSDPWMATADSVEEFASKGHIQELTELLNCFFLCCFLAFVAWFGLCVYEVSTQERLPPFPPVRPVVKQSGYYRPKTAPMAESEECRAAAIQRLMNRQPSHRPELYKWQAAHISRGPLFNRWATSAGTAKQPAAMKRSIGPSDEDRSALGKRREVQLEELENQHSPRPGCEQQKPQRQSRKHQRPDKIRQPHDNQQSQQSQMRQLDQLRQMAHASMPSTMEPANEACQDVEEHEDATLDEMDESPDLGAAAGMRWLQWRADNNGDFDTDTDDDQDDQDDNGAGGLHSALPLHTVSQRHPRADHLDALHEEAMKSTSETVLADLTIKVGSPPPAKWTNWRNVPNAIRVGPSKPRGKDNTLLSMPVNASSNRLLDQIVNRQRIATIDLASLTIDASSNTTAGLSNFGGFPNATTAGPSDPRGSDYALLTMPVNAGYRRVNVPVRRNESPDLMDTSSYTTAEPSNSCGTPNTTAGPSTSRGSDSALLSMPVSGRSSRITVAVRTNESIDLLDTSSNTTAEPSNPCGTPNTTAGPSNSRGSDSAMPSIPANGRSSRFTVPVPTNETPDLMDTSSKTTAGPSKSRRSDIELLSIPKKKRVPRVREAPDNQDASSNTTAGLSNIRGAPNTTASPSTSCGSDAALLSKPVNERRVRFAVSVEEDEAARLTSLTKNASSTTARPSSSRGTPNTTAGPSNPRGSVNALPSQSVNMRPSRFAISVPGSLDEAPVPASPMPVPTSATTHASSTTARPSNSSGIPNTTAGLSNIRGSDNASRLASTAADTDATTVDADAFLSQMSNGSSTTARLSDSRGDPHATNDLILNAPADLDAPVDPSNSHGMVHTAARSRSPRGIKRKFPTPLRPTFYEGPSVRSVQDDEKWKVRDVLTSVHMADLTNPSRGAKIERLGAADYFDSDEEDDDSRRKKKISRVDDGKGKKKATGIDVERSRPLVDSPPPRVQEENLDPLPDYEDSDADCPM